MKFCHAASSVYLSVPIPFTVRFVTQKLIALLVGNSSSLLTTSGVFSEAIALTAGQYGYELISGLCQSIRLIRAFRKIYCITRVTTLTAVVLNLVGLDVPNKIDCQVSAVSCAYYMLAL